MSDLWKLNVWSIPRIGGILVGFFVYVFGTRILPLLIIWAVDSYDLRMTTELDYTMRIVALLTDARTPLPTLVAIFTTAIISAKTARVISPTRANERTKRKIEKATDHTENTEIENADPNLTWKGIG